jgi:hypothetical protein
LRHNTANIGDVSVCVLTRHSYDADCDPTAGRDPLAGGLPCGHLSLLNMINFNLFHSSQGYRFSAENIDLH